MTGLHPLNTQVRSSVSRHRVVPRTILSGIHCPEFTKHYTRRDGPAYYPGFTDLHMVDQSNVRQSQVCEGALGTRSLPAC